MTRASVEVGRPQERRQATAAVQVRRSALLCTALLFTGCQATPERLDSNIIRVATFYVNRPFVSFDAEGDPNPEGLKVTYYAVSGTTQRGAHGDGVIRFKMYAIDRRRGEEPVGRLVKTWEFTPAEARGWRVTRQSDLLGWPYQFYLNWGDVDVYGREVRIVPEFERRDGLVVRGSSRDLKVPQRKMAVQLSDQPAENQEPSRGLRTEDED